VISPVGVTFLIPGPLRAFTDGRTEVEVGTPAATLQDALDTLGALYPGIRDRVLTERGAVREHINIFVGSEDSRYTGGLATPLPASARISIVPAISGGCGTKSHGQNPRTAAICACLPRRELLWPASIHVH
jgi:molybdopterin converting factor small subunit